MVRPSSYDLPALLPAFVGRTPRREDRPAFGSRWNAAIDSPPTSEEVATDRETETVEPLDAPPAEDEAAEQDEKQSVTELLVQLGRNVSVLAFCEAQLETSRHMPEVRRTVRDVAAAVLVAFAFLTAFVFVNVAAFQGLATAMSDWLAALVLGVAWLIVGLVLLTALMVRAGQVTGWKWWRVFREGPEAAHRDLEQARDDAVQAVRDTLEQLAPAVTVEIATASISMAGDVADGVVDAGEDILETSEEIVEAIAEELPGGSIVNQIWDVALIPGRFGIKVATTVLKRGDGDGTSATS
ncbi:MAG TPA: phage holin family protein [Gaiellaceae bacterium]|nr:phage holin family protein [Gaiellaceae bacterium]